VTGTPETTSIVEALERLKHEPSQPVRLRIEGLEIELRVVAAPRRRRSGPGLGTRMAAAGPWEGESTEEIIRILHEGRYGRGNGDPPENL
jgi:hypothetical protein